LLLVISSEEDMLSRGFLILIIWIPPYLGLGQNVQWASEVIDYSDEFSPLNSSASQILGEPNVLPETKIDANAWSPGRSKKEHFITVGFQEPMLIRQTAIAESFNPGALKEVYAIDTDDNAFLLYSLRPKRSEQEGRMFNFIFDETTYEVAKLKLIFDGQMYGGKFYIDAVAISDSDIPIRAEVQIINAIKKDLIVEALGENINSPFSEIRPLLSPDGQTLYFSRKNHKDNAGGLKDEEDIWHSSWNEALQAWEPAENIGAPLNNKERNFISSISPYGDMTLAIMGSEYASSGKSKPGLSISNTTTQGWSAPVTMDFSNDPNFEGEFDFAQSPDRKIIVFAVRRDDSRGGKDLYVAFLQRNGTWTEPLNMGSDLNTVNEEASPFLAKDGHTLYFASSGFSGYGGTDIYTSQRLDNSWQKWSKPENLGPSINSSLDEKHFNIPTHGRYAYFTKYLEEDNADVFRVELPLFEEPVAPPAPISVNANLVDKTTGEPIIGSLTLSNSNMTLNGKSFKVNMLAGKIYQCVIEAEGYVTHNETIDLNGKTPGEILEFEIRMKRTVETLIFEKINFSSNHAWLLEESFDDLNEIIRILKENPEIHIEVASHTDNIGDEKTNLELSKLRSEAIFGYLTQTGNIDPDRIMLKWYGETQPIATNETPEGRSKNRRVEFTIRR